MKYCNKCGYWKKYSEFNKDKKSKDNLSYICSECAKIKMRNKRIEYKQNNKNKYKLPESKICKNCKEQKSKSEFSKDDTMKDGLRALCKICDKQKNKIWQKNNPEKVNEISKRYHNSKKGKERRRIYYLENKEYILNKGKGYRKQNKEHIKNQKRNYYLKNKEKRKEYFKKFYRENKHIFVNNSNLRDFKKKRATPNWLTQNQLDQIKEVYRQRQQLQELTNIEFHVDHIVPINGDNVCGLHVPWNLQILTFYDNLKKNNKLIS